MLKFVNTATGSEECFLYSKIVPRLGDLVLKGGKYYRVNEIIFDDDEGDIIVEVTIDTNRTNTADLFKDVPKEIMDQVKRDILNGRKLHAVRLLSNASGASLKESKDYFEELQNNMKK